MLEGEQPLLRQRMNKLDDEKWIASSLFLNQLRQRGDALRFAVKSIRNQPSQILTGKGGKDDFVHYRSTLADRFELAHQRMSGINLVVSVGAHQQQVLHFLL